MGRVVAEHVGGHPRATLVPLVRERGEGRVGACRGIGSEVDERGISGWRSVLVGGGTVGGEQVHSGGVKPMLYSSD